MSPQTRIQAQASGYWLEREQWLAGGVCAQLPPGLGFKQAPPVARPWGEKGFFRWDGLARHEPSALGDLSKSVVGGCSRQNPAAPHLSPLNQEPTAVFPIPVGRRHSKIGVTAVAKGRITAPLVGKGEGPAMVIRR